MEVNKDFYASISFSTRELSAREKAKLMYSPCDFKLKNLEDGTIIDIADYAVVNVHNEHAKNKDYTVYKYFLTNGEVCDTSSTVFHSRFENYYDTIVSSGECDSVEVKIKRENSSYETDMLVAVLV